MRRANHIARDRFQRIVIGDGNNGLGSEVKDEIRTEGLDDAGQLLEIPHIADMVLDLACQA